MRRTAKLHLVQATAFVKVQHCTLERPQMWSRLYSQTRTFVSVKYLALLLQDVNSWTQFIWGSKSGFEAEILFADIPGEDINCVLHDVFNFIEVRTVQTWAVRIRVTALAVSEGQLRLTPTLIVTVIHGGVLRVDPANMCFSS